MRAARILVLAVVTLGTASAQPAPPDTLRAPAALEDSLTVFGWSVVADDATLLVGADERRGSAALAAGELLGDPKGTVFVYRMTETGPVLDGRLVSDRVGNQDCFSWSLDVRGDLAAVGAACEFDGSGSGSVYLYRRGADGWQREAKLLRTDVPEPYRRHYYFGDALALGDELLVVGAAFDNPASPMGDGSSGSVVVFERLDAAWVQTDVILNDDADVALNESFGSSLALSGPRGAETLFVGAYTDSDPGMYGRGSVYVFEHIGGAWVQRAKLLCDNPRASDFCGATLSAGPQGEAVVATLRSVQPLDRIDGVWTLGPPLNGQDRFLNIGLARHGDVIAGLNAFRSPNPDPLHIFHRNGDGWHTERIAVPELGTYTDYLVSMNATHVLVGQPLSGDGVTVTDDAVLIYRRDGFVAVEPAPASRALTLRLAPNPTAGAATVFVSLPIASTLRTEVVDVQGRVVWRAEEAAAAGDHAVALDLSGVAAGVYVVRVTAGGETGQIPVVRR